MVSLIESGNEEAVADLANTLAEVQAAQDTAASQVAEWQTNFDEQMAAIESSMQKSMDNVLTGMDISDETYSKGQAALQEYANGIIAMKDTVYNAALQVAQAAKSAISSVSLNASVSVAGHAGGTTNAEGIFMAGEQGHELIMRNVDAYANGTMFSSDFYLAGENGPELIVGQPGSTVFPTSETDRILNALDNRRPLNIVSNPSGDGGNGRRYISREDVRRIILEINGNGSIDISSGNEQAVLAILQDNMEPILMSLLRENMFNEGDRSYVY